MTIAIGVEECGVRDMIQGGNFASVSQSITIGVALEGSVPVFVALTKVPVPVSK